MSNGSRPRLPQAGDDRSLEAGHPAGEGGGGLRLQPDHHEAHYIALDETAVADEVLSAIAGMVKPGAVSNGPPTTGTVSGEKGEDHGQGDREGAG